MHNQLIVLFVGQETYDVDLHRKIIIKLIYQTYALPANSNFSNGIKQSKCKWLMSISYCIYKWNTIFFTHVEIEPNELEKHKLADNFF